MFIEDIKLYATDSTNLQIIYDGSKDGFKYIGLDINFMKSATNSKKLTELPYLYFNTCYKYLGILENNKSLICNSNKNIIKNRMYKRINDLCSTDLNSKNLFKAINEYGV